MEESVGRKLAKKGKKKTKHVSQCEALKLVIETGYREYIRSNIWTGLYTLNENVIKV